MFYLYKINLTSVPLYYLPCAFPERLIKVFNGSAACTTNLYRKLVKGLTATKVKKQALTAVQKFYRVVNIIIMILINLVSKIVIYNSYYSRAGYVVYCIQTTMKCNHKH